MIMVRYTNKDFYDYIIKVDNISNPLHVKYQRILPILISIGLDEPLSKDAIRFFFNLFSLPENDEDEIRKLNNVLFLDSSLYRLIKNEHNSYSVYPSLKELPSKDDLLIYYSLKLKMSAKEIIDYLTPLVAKKIENFKKVPIDNYYGTPNYIILRTKAVYDAMTMLNSRDDIEEKNLVYESMTKTYVLLCAMLKAVGLEDNPLVYTNLNDFHYKVSLSKEQYDFMKESYEKVLNLEKGLNDVSRNIWHAYELANDGVLIHQLTGEAVESDKMDKICTSFYSNNIKYITNLFSASIGYAYPMDIDYLFTICEGDVGSWLVSKDEFIELGLPETWQLDGSNLWYEYPHHSKLFPPEYIEEVMTKRKRYAEIIIDNRFKKIKPAYVFYTPYATQEQIDKAHELAKKQGLEVKCLEINNVRSFG